MASKNKAIYFLVLGLLCLLSTFFFIGQYTDPQDGDLTLFLKYRPTIQQYFYSPVAYHRFHPTSLTPSEIIDENAFQEFIVQRNLLNKVYDFIIIPSILIQLSLTLLLYGICATRLEIKGWQVSTQFILNAPVTYLILLIITFSDPHINPLILTGLSTLLLNIFIILFLNRFSKKTL